MKINFLTEFLHLFTFFGVISEFPYGADGTTDIRSNTQKALIFLRSCINGERKCSHGDIKSLNYYTKSYRNESKRDIYQARFLQMYMCYKEKNNPTLCPVDGGWSLWTEWSMCSSECGAGSRHRYRRCNNPVATNSGLRCEGETDESKGCYKECESSPGKDVNEAQTCLNDIHRKFPKLKRVCVDQHCSYKQITKFITKVYEAEEYWTLLHCIKYHQACPVDGGWSDWSHWSLCNTHCSQGQQYRTRTCTQPQPKYAGLQCQGKQFEEKSCLVMSEMCKPTSMWGRDIWSAFSPCSMSCGVYGVMVSQRRCHDPKHCSQLIEKIVKPCYIGPCHKAGGWSDYSNWSACSAKCGKGRETRVRYCNHPVPLGGLYCTGSEVIVRDCTSRVDCTPQTDSQHKDVDIEDISPLLQYPTIASGDPYNKTYNIELEPLYKQWSPWSACSKECGRGGSRLRTRVCVTSGVPCTGETRQRQYCNTHQCPVNGGWSDWEAWSICSVTCGKGRQLRYRRCDQPYPQYGGTCTGSHQIQRTCSRKTCKVVKWKWEKWSPWGVCSSSCGLGVKSRTRSCNSKTGALSTRCIGSDVKTVTCHAGLCPVNGEWASWAGWSPCTAKCGVGYHYRDRTCTDPTPLGGGKTCEGAHTRRRPCFLRPCQKGDNKIITFLSESSLKYAARAKPRRFLHIYIRFKTAKDNGVVIHRHHVNCTKKCSHEVVIGVNNRHVFVKVHSYGVKMFINSSHILKKHDWHDILLTILQQNGSLRVDDNRPELGSYQTKLPRIVDYAAVMFVGNKDPKLQQTLPINFVGNTSSIRVNFNELDLLSQSDWEGYGTPIKSKSVHITTSDDSGLYPHFRGNSYIKFPISHNSSLHIRVNIRSSSLDGLLLFTEGRVAGSYLAMGLRRGVVFLCINASPTPRRVCRKTGQIKLQHWYQIVITVTHNQATFTLDKNSAVQISARGPAYKPGDEMFIGGGPRAMWPVFQLALKNMRGFNGVVQAVKVNDKVFLLRNAPLVTNDSLISSVGFSLSGHVSVVIVHGRKHDIRLQCDYTAYIDTEGDVDIVWLKDNSILLLNQYYTLTTLPGMDRVSVLLVHPSPKVDLTGIYACQLYYQGDYFIPRAFVLLNPASKPVYVKMTVASVERAAIVVLVFIVLVILMFAGGRLVRKYVRSKTYEYTRLGTETDAGDSSDDDSSGEGGQEMVYISDDECVITANLPKTDDIESTDISAITQTDEVTIVNEVTEVNKVEIDDVTDDSDVGGKTEKMADGTDDVMTDDDDDIITEKIVVEVESCKSTRRHDDDYEVKPSSSDTQTPNTSPSSSPVTGES